MKLGDKVRVKDGAGIDLVYRDRTGTVVADSAAGEMIEVEFAEETVTHSFNAADLNEIQWRAIGYWRRKMLK